MGLFYMLMVMYFFGLFRGLSPIGDEEHWLDVIALIFLSLIAAACWPLIILAKIYKVIWNRK